MCMYTTYLCYIACELIWEIYYHPSGIGVVDHNFVIRVLPRIILARNRYKLGKIEKSKDAIFSKTQFIAFSFLLNDFLSDSVCALL